MEAIFNFVIQKSELHDQRMITMYHQSDFKKYIQDHQGQHMIMTLSPAVKTPEKERMYAFYHKVVLGAAIQAFTDAGWEAVDKVKADYMLKAECARGIMYNKLTGEEDVFLEDKSAMTKDRLHKYISDCIHLLETELMTKVPDGDGFRREDSEGFVSI